MEMESEFDWDAGTDACGAHSIISLDPMLLHYGDLEGIVASFSPESDQTGTGYDHFTAGMFSWRFWKGGNLKWIWSGDKFYYSKCT